MDYNALRQNIREEAGKGTMEILSESLGLRLQR